MLNQRIILKADIEIVIQFPYAYWDTLDNILILSLSDNLAVYCL